MTVCKRFRYRAHRGLVSAFLLLLTLAGCGGDGVRLTALDVRQIGWDTLRVAPRFEKAGFGRDVIIPDSLTVLVSDTRGRTLYTGYAHRPRRPVVVPVPDPLLGSGAPFMVDLCGYFEGRDIVCEQQVLNASPKRLHAELALDYPYKRQTDKLSYRVAWRQERARSGGGWQPVPVARAIPARFVVYVAGHPRDAVKVDFDDNEGIVDLTKAPGYNDFWMQLHDPLLRGDSVEVKVQLDGRLGSRPDSVTTFAYWIAPVSEQERRAEAMAFADQALDRMLEKLETARDGRAVLEVLAWRYDPLQQTYNIRVWMGWRGGFLHRNEFTLEGELIVDEETRNATLRATRLSGDMQRLWLDRVAGETMRLGSLERD